MKQGTLSKLIGGSVTQFSGKSWGDITSKDEEAYYYAKVIAARKHAYQEILHNIKNYSIATISACRVYRREAYTRYRDEHNLKYNQPANPQEEVWADEYLINRNENLRRHKELQLQLHKAGLEGIMPIYGCYPEEGADIREISLEMSYICFHKDYFYLVDKITKLGKLFEQDSVCVLRPDAKRGTLIKTSPKDINAGVKYRWGEAIMVYSGMGFENVRDVNKSLMDYFSRVGHTNFWWDAKIYDTKGYQDDSKGVLQAHRLVLGIQSAMPGLLATDYRSLAIQTKGQDYTAPENVITTTKGVFSSWYDLSKPHKDRSPLHFHILKAMMKDEKSL